MDMTTDVFDPKAEVDAGIVFLSTRLNPIIAERLKDVLQGLPWTAILEELDRAKNYRPVSYNAADIQPQLRMLTERLGGLAFPFDDHTRLVSTLGSELRIFRNRWAHNYELTSLDAMRMLDAVKRLLSYFGDGEGEENFHHRWLKALEAVASEQGIDASSKSDAIQGVSRARKRLYIEENPGERESEEVRPAAEVLKRKNLTETPRIGGDREEFEAWAPVEAGETQILDDIARNYAKHQIRSLAVEIVDFEGPVHLDRLIRFVAASYGVSRVHKKRRQQIERQICQAGPHVDGDKFVWPEHIERETWSEFRPNSSDVSRAFEHISPIEIANAVRFIKADNPQIRQENLEVLTLQTFGRKRRVETVKRHLRKALERV